MMTQIDVEAVRAAAGSVRDPEIRRSLGDMGLLDDIQIEGGQVTEIGRASCRERV